MVDRLQVTHSLHTYCAGFYNFPRMVHLLRSLKRMRTNINGLYSGGKAYLLLRSVSVRSQGSEVYPIRRSAAWHMHQDHSFPASAHGKDIPGGREGLPTDVPAGSLGQAWPFWRMPLLGTGGGGPSGGGGCGCMPCGTASTLAQAVNGDILIPPTYNLVDKSPVRPTLLAAQKCFIFHTKIPSERVTGLRRIMCTNQEPAVLRMHAVSPSPDAGVQA